MKTTYATNQLGRRERNKQEKLERITEAARELFAEKSVSSVTTAEVAAKADVAAGTLFLYAKTKGELLLLAQNANYRGAHQAGLKASAAKTEIVPALIALITPIVKCNREHVENGRTYLMEVVFGSSKDSHRLEALELMHGTETSAAQIIATKREPEQAQLLAKTVMSVMFLTLSSPSNVGRSNSEILGEIQGQLDLLFLKAAPALLQSRVTYSV
jgi:AcrR family transcriptional regulator